MRTTTLGRRHSSSHLLCATALSVAFAAGCGAEPSTGSSDQFDTEEPAPAAACSAVEIEPLLACSAEPCTGFSGDPLNECIAESCPESVFDVSQGCAECIIVNLSSVEDIAQFCGAPAEPKPAACTAAEMDPLLACSAEPCEDLAGDPLTECMDQSCPESVWDVSMECANCIVGNLASVDSFAQACSG